MKPKWTKEVVLSVLSKKGVPLTAIDVAKIKLKTSHDFHGDNFWEYTVNLKQLEKILEELIEEDVIKKEFVSERNKTVTYFSLVK